MVSRAAILIAFSSLLGACGPEPVYDDRIDVQAVPTERGALAGTFALQTISNAMVDVPLLGEKEGISLNFRLVTRTWDDAEGFYLQRSLLCGGQHDEVAGIQSTVPESTYRAVPESKTERIDGDHAEGTYVATGHVQLWAIRDLPDPHETPLPETLEESETEPHKSRIYDMDGDGHPGYTDYATGLVTGEVYGIKRKWVDLDGVTLGPDHIVGLAENRYEGLQLGNNNELLDGKGSSQKPHPDPKENWFEEVRIDEGADCDDVIAAVEDGTLSRLRPF
jgi:hypothetical protein